MSLKQHGNHTAINKTMKIPVTKTAVIGWCVFIIMCAADAQVLIRI
jgi:hypothetical protein